MSLYIQFQQRLVQTRPGLAFSELYYISKMSIYNDDLFQNCHCILVIFCCSTNFNNVSLNHCGHIDNVMMIYELVVISPYS